MTDLEPKPRVPVVDDFEAIQKRREELFPKPAEPKSGHPAINRIPPGTGGSSELLKHLREAGFFTIKSGLFR